MMPLNQSVRCVAGRVALVLLGGVAGAAPLFRRYWIIISLGSAPSQIVWFPLLGVIDLNGVW